MKGAEIRQAFLDFFKSKGHSIVSSSSLVPSNDPTLLFANSGMVQFKDCFLGADKRAYTRATTCQKCLRISGKHNDFENVGVTARHHTFFEMLGNFSFGDYFKKEAIGFAWEFVTNVLKLPKNKLWVTIYEKDDEAAELWKSQTDVDPSRILKMDEKSNFWEMGETGPCGPCSEIFYFTGKDDSSQSEEDFRKDDGTYIEIWNLVFMQYFRGPDRKLTPLPRPSVDTGMGLERTASVVQGVNGNYESDLVRDVIAYVEKLSGHRYDGSSYEIRDLKKDTAYARDVAMRVIADHSRAAVFLIADGIHPGSDGRGYVLRRIIRRAIRHGRVLGFKEPFLNKTADKVISLMGGYYTELAEQRDMIVRVVKAEEEKFLETLESGLSVLTREVEKLKPGQPFPGETAFLLHDTYGFPLDLTEDALKVYSRKVDAEAFTKAMSAQRERSREDRKSQGITFTSITVEGAPTKFLGYDSLEAEAKLTHVVGADNGKKIAKGERVTLLFDATPFYAESGGQVGDTGTIRFEDVALQVLDTQKVQGKHFVHDCEVLDGEFTASLKGSAATLLVDGIRREKIRANHSATHLLHSGLRTILGNHVKQAGSRVDDETLRFDYSHFEPVSQGALNEIQSFVNEQIRKNHDVHIQEMAIDDAKKRGAMALFGEKYGDVVRVVEIGPQSLELCGGTHVRRSGDIGFLLVGSETGVSAGVRRIECWAGFGAHAELLKERADKHQIAQLLKSDASHLPDKIEKVLQRTKQLERELEEAKARLASSASSDLSSSARTTPSGIKVIAQKIEGVDMDTLKSMVDTLRVKIGSGVVALASSQGDKGVFVAGVTSDLTSTVNAGKLVSQIAKLGGGKGGGRADFAQAGGLDSSMIASSLEKFVELIS